MAKEGNNGDDRLQGLQMTTETLYLVKDTLLGLLDNPIVENIDFAALSAGGRLRLALKPGSHPALSAEPDRSTIEIRFMPGRLLACWFSRSGDRLVWSAERRGDAAENDCLFDLINRPLSIPQLSGGRAVATSDTMSEKAAGLSVGRETLARLAAADMIDDLTIGSNGHEMSLQFRLVDGFAGVAIGHPSDWVGMDFTAKVLDICWFDRAGRFRLSSFDLIANRAAAAAAVADPLFHVLSACAEEDRDMTAMLADLARLMRAGGQMQEPRRRH